MSYEDQLEIGEVLLYPDIGEDGGRISISLWKGTLEVWLLPNGGDAITSHILNQQ